MATENGNIVIGVAVDSTDAVQGLGQISAALDDASNDIESMAKVADKKMGQVDDSSKDAARGLRDLATQANNTDNAVTDFGSGASTASIGARQLRDSSKGAVVGLDDLKDKSGESASSLSALAGAVSVVSPELGTALSSASALAGGLEGASKATALFGGSVRAMMLTIAPVGAVLLAAAAAMAIMRKEAEAADRAMDIMAGRQEAIGGITERTVEARNALALLTGETNIYRLEMEEITEQRRLDEVAIESQRHRLGQLSEDERANAEQELALAIQRADETESLNRSLARRAAAERGRARDAQEAAEIEAEIARQQAASSVAATEALAEQSRLQGIANLNRRYELDLLRETNPIQAEYLMTMDAINASVGQGLDERLASLSRIQAEWTRSQALMAQEDERNLEASTAAFEESEARRQAAIEQTMRIEEERVKSAQAVTLAMTGFMDMAAASSQENAEVMRGIALFETTINGLSAGIKAYSELGPVLGGIAAAGIAASTTAALMQISATPLTKKHEGGIIGGMGDMPVMAQGGEAVLNRLAVSNLGEQGVQNLNSGGSSGSGSITVEMTYKQRAFDRVVIDNMREGGPLTDAINQAERRGRRGRVGGLL